MGQQSSCADLKKMLEQEEKNLKERVLIEDGRTYTGIIKWYSKKNKEGIIHLNERIFLKGYTLLYIIKFDKKDSVFLSRETIPQRGTEVMFSIWDTKKGLKACRIKNIDGTPIGIFIESSKSENDDANKRKREEEEESCLSARRQNARSLTKVKLTAEF